MQQQTVTRKNRGNLAGYLVTECTGRDPYMTPYETKRTDELAYIEGFRFFLTIHCLRLPLKTALPAFAFTPRSIMCISSPSLSWTVFSLHVHPDRGTLILILSAFIRDAVRFRSGRPKRFSGTLIDPCEFAGCVWWRPRFTYCVLAAQ